MLLTCGRRYAVWYRYSWSFRKSYGCTTTHHQRVVPGKAIYTQRGLRTSEGSSLKRPGPQLYTVVELYDKIREGQYVGVLWTHELVEGNVCVVGRDVTHGVLQRSNTREEAIALVHNLPLSQNMSSASSRA